MTNGSGTVDITPFADGVTESETFTVEIRKDSVSGTILAVSPTITITDAAAIPGTDITSSFYQIATRFIDSQVYMGNPADYTGPYDVTEVQTLYSGTTLFIGVKFTASTNFYNDVPIAAVQILDSTNTTLLYSYVFHNSVGGTGGAWTTTTSSPGQNTGQGFPITPATAAGLSYSSIVSGSTVNKMNWASSTSSSYTGCADGISSAYTTTIMPLGIAAINQTLGSYYMYCETSGVVVDGCSVAKSPPISIPAHSWIRVAHALTGPTASQMDPTDTLWVGIQ
jgi:hypothetical protein